MQCTTNTIHNFISTIGESLHETSCIKQVIILKFTSIIATPVQLSRY